MTSWQCLRCGDLYDPEDPYYESLSDWAYDHDTEVEETS